MIAFDVRQLALNLTMGQEEPHSVREALIVRLIEAAVEIVNYPHRFDSIMEALEPVYELEYNVPQPAALIARYVNHIKTHKKKYGWDDRLLIKAEFKLVGQMFHRASIKMDLDATILDKSEKILEEVTDVSNVVNDNPDTDTINELLRTLDRETRRRPPVLSDRYAKSVGQFKSRG